jgi:uncharacterized membrane protein
MNATPPEKPSSAQPIVPAAASSAMSPPPHDGWAVGANRGVAWWSEGWRLFTASPVIWIVITLLYVALSIGLALIPIIGHIAGTLLTPVLAGGVLLGCRELGRGRELTVAHLFAAFGTKLGPLVLLGVLWFAGWVVAFLVALAVGAASFGLGSLSAVWSGDPMQMMGALGIGLAALVLVVLLPLLMAYWFAPALVTLRNDEPFGAMKTSFVASLRNIPPFLVYGLLGIVFAIVATIPLGLGWLVLAPVFAASVYASYKDVFAD